MQIMSILYSNKSTYAQSFCLGITQRHDTAKFDEFAGDFTRKNLKNEKYLKV